MSSQLSESERLELAAKLDRELDDFIDNLPKRKPEEPVPFERWEEELIKHPFFMKETPQDGDDVHPLYEGLQKLKYDPELNEPNELAQSYKDDGNFNYKHKKYRMAIISYTEGIRTGCTDQELLATLYNNRSAAHYLLKNYRSAILDGEQALKLSPNYTKPLHRLCQCYQHLEKYEKALEYCDKLLDKDAGNREIQELRQKCLNLLKLQQRNQRKRDLNQRKQQQEEQRLLDEIKRRQIRFDSGAELTIKQLEPQFPELFNCRVYLDTDTAQLVWPVILFYPEYKIMDYIQEFGENCRFYDQLQQVFEDYPEWDIEKTYTIDRISLYYENNRFQYKKVDLNRTLLEMLQQPDFILKEGTPRFIVLISGSRVETNFLKSL